AVPLLVRVGAMRDRVVAGEAGAADEDSIAARRETAIALLAWATPYRDLASLRAAIADTRRRIDGLRRDDAPLTLATVHGTKGLEWDHVAVVGMEAGRFPSRRSVDEAEEPERALEEERRLAYVAWTRPRRSLTLVYDPAAPSVFLLEAFDAAELAAAAPRRRDAVTP
ncbi:MAG: 3'-5' exonuclease, partial [Gaiellaceae bacterium]